MKGKIIKYIQKKYGAKPEYLWKRYPGYAVYRHEDNRKWFALTANIMSDMIGAPGAEEIEVVNVKIDDLMLRDILLQQEGYYPGYHMNKKCWVSIILDDTLSDEEIRGRIADSHERVKEGK
jgi:predicted DNA-binding protein (MmcQ/YjbR family)